MCGTTITRTFTSMTTVKSLGFWIGTVFERCRWVWGVPAIHRGSLAIGIPGATTYLWTETGKLGRKTRQRPFQDTASIMQIQPRAWVWQITIRAKQGSLIFWKRSSLASVTDLHDSTSQRFS